jgi:redox-sensitive bicupin YhaK (pirin superfamily)
VALQRKIVRKIETAAPAPGFLGEGHQAGEVVGPNDFVLQDPFILLMDDRLDIPSKPLGEPHPYAGFEMVTPVLEGAIRDRYEGGELNAGDLQWMTAGARNHPWREYLGAGKVRLLQLRLTLPKSRRGTTPRSQIIQLVSVPMRREEGVDQRISEVSKRRDFI